MTGLGLDAGGSATRWALVDGSGTLLARGDLPPVSGHLFRAGERARLAEIATTLATTLAGRPVTAVLGGMTGLASASPEAALATGILAAALHLPPDRVVVHDDLWLLCRALFPPGCGIVVYAGTGSVAGHLRADGTLLRAGGRGMLIDDGGSAFWIGREALRHVWRARDANPAASGALAEALAAAIGAPDWEATRRHVYAAEIGGARDAVAQLARVVAACPDPEATAILHQAGAELARLAHAVTSRLGAPHPVALAGRAAALSPAILAGFRAAAPDLPAELRTPDSALAAARLAAGRPAD